MRYDLDWGRRGGKTSSWLKPSIYLSIVLRSLAAGTLLVAIEMLPMHG